MTKHRIAILWGQDNVLAQAMQTFLTEEETWEVIRIPSTQCTCSLVEQVQKVRPDLVIFCQGSYGDDSDPLVKLLQEQPDLRVIADQPESKIITVSLENNVMQVYSKHSITVRKVSDLLSVIEDRYFSENPVQEVK
jgi:hypothetical protein